MMIAGKQQTSEHQQMAICFCYQHYVLLVLAAKLRADFQSPSLCLFEASHSRSHACWPKHKVSLDCRGQHGSSLPCIRPIHLNHPKMRLERWPLPMCIPLGPMPAWMLLMHLLMLSPSTVPNACKAVLHGASQVCTSARAARSCLKKLKTIHHQSRWKMMSHQSWSPSR